MPRMKGLTAEFGPLIFPIEVSLTNIGATVTNLVDINTDTQSMVEATLIETMKTRLGHELYLWETEIDELE